MLCLVHCFKTSMGLAPFHSVPNNAKSCSGLQLGVSNALRISWVTDFADTLDELVIALLVFGVQVVLVLDVIDLRLELLELVRDFRELRTEIQHVNTVFQSFEGFCRKNCCE